MRMYADDDWEDDYYPPADKPEPDYFPEDDE